MNGPNKHTRDNAKADGVHSAREMSKGNTSEQYLINF